MQWLYQAPGSNTKIKNTKNYKKSQQWQYLKHLALTLASAEWTGSSSLSFVPWRLKRFKEKIDMNELLSRPQNLPHTVFFDVPGLDLPCCSSD